MKGFENFKYIIAEERRRAHLTQEALARILGVTPQAVSKWENGVGYPDVTLFPEIARALGVPIERLFGETRESDSKHDLPETFDGMPLVLKHREKRCYSSKSVVSVDETLGRVVFGDGSSADLAEGFAVNCGEGEIRIFKEENLASFSDGSLTSVCFDADQLDAFDELKISLGWPCVLDVLTADGGGKRVCAEGCAGFISALKVDTSGGRLTVECNNHHGSPSGRAESNRLTVYTGFSRGRSLELSANGNENCRIEPDFDRAKISINGSGLVEAAGAGDACLKINGNGDMKFGKIDGKGELSINGNGSITAPRAGEAKISINGSGDVKVDAVDRMGDISVNGSGDVRIGSAVGIKININGSSDVRIDLISGDAEARINGSGDVTCVGEVDSLKLRVNGAASFNGKGLIVGEADIKTRDHSRAEITLAQIRRKSIEQLASETILRVAKRG